jgi:DNA-binding NarL/FixJ family response regulator
VGAAATARVRTATGRWLLVRGSLLGEGPDARIAVTLEAARSAELAPMIAEAYGLTARERLVTQLVAQGFSTAQISEHLHLSAYTVQDHLKAIFEKLGVSSRGELVARLFFEHYLPRLTS